MLLSQLFCWGPPSNFIQESQNVEWEIIATPRNPRAVYFQRDSQMYHAWTTFESGSRSFRSRVSEAFNKIYMFKYLGCQCLWASLCCHNAHPAHDAEPAIGVLGKSHVGKSPDPNLLLWFASVFQKEACVILDMVSIFLLYKSEKLFCIKRKKLNKKRWRIGIADSETKISSGASDYQLCPSCSPYLLFCL